PSVSFCFRYARGSNFKIERERERERERESSDVSFPLPDIFGQNVERSGVPAASNRFYTHT
ncbi:unnamed protein product, partial [Musa acuminata subsp. burmannicoides]